MISKFNLVALVAVVGVLFINKPSQAEIEQEIRDIIVRSINAEQIDKTDDFLSGFLTLTCKFDAESCYKVVRATMQVSYDDRILFAAVGLRTGDKQRNCIGALKNIFCPSFLNR